MSLTRTDAIRPEFDPERGTYEVYHDTDSSWEVSTTLVLSLSSLTDDDPRQMRSLNSVVDPDVLNGHVRGRNSGATLSFEFHDHRVTVQDDGHLELFPLRDDDYRSSGIRV